MLKLVGFLVLACAGACVTQARPHVVEPADPEVGDMSCAPPMSIHSLLHPDPPPAQATHCDV
jgi:hypothetical protein